MNSDHAPTSRQSPGDTDAFLNGSPFAVVGASADRSKYGNKVLRVYLQNNEKVYPVNPRGGEIEGLAAYPDLASLPELPHAVSIITPPSVTERVVEEAVELGIKHLWMQPGAESDAAISYARENGVNVVAKGPCVLVVMGFHGP
jgi:predicted CoA-binding protein